MISDCFLGMLIGHVNKKASNNKQSEALPGKQARSPPVCTNIWTHTLCTAMAPNYAMGPLCHHLPFPFSLCAPQRPPQQSKGTRVQVTPNRSASQNLRSQPQPKVCSTLPYSRSAWWSISHCASGPTAYAATPKIITHTHTHTHTDRQHGQRT